MAVTKSWEAGVLETRSQASRAGPRRVGWRELAWLVCSSLLVAAGLLLVYSAKTQNFREAANQLARGELLDLNRVESPADLLPFLLVFPEPERQSTANRVFDYLAAHRPLPNVGALARLRQAAGSHAALLPLAKLKPAFVVRTPRDFQQRFALLDRRIFRGILCRVSGLEKERFSRRFFRVTRASSPDRRRSDFVDKLARPFARHARVQQIRLGRGPGLHRAAIALPAGARLSAFLPLVLHAAVRRVCAIRAVASIRLGSRRQRCESESRARSSRWRPSRFCWFSFWPVTSRAIGSACAICVKSACFRAGCNGSACRASRTSCR